MECKAFAWVAIRLSSDGYEWMDITTMSHLYQQVQDKCNKDDYAAGRGWAEANRVLRIVAVDIKES